MIQVDVLIYGGGIAGLWALSLLRHAGYRTLLLENNALGAGQTIQSQGIIHGGVKYAIPGVRDLDATAEIRNMPAHWKNNLQGKDTPDLSSAIVHSKECLFWIPTEDSTRFLDQAGLRLLNTRPRSLPKNEWPDILSGSASVYAVAEPVVDTGSLLKSLLAANHGYVRKYEGDLPRVDAKLTVLAAGKGNAGLLEHFGFDPNLMQLRPLCMILARGALPRLYGHCIERGKTTLTITSHPWRDEVVWQVGGQIAEKYANETDYARVRRGAVEALKSHLPRLDFDRLQIATYRALRAEGTTAGTHRPSGVQVVQVAPNIIAAWPTKLALAPVLAAEIVKAASAIARPSEAKDLNVSEWPTPPIAPYPWDQAQWFSVA